MSTGMDRKPCEEMLPPRTSNYLTEGWTTEDLHTDKAIMYTYSCRKPRLTLFAW